MGCRGLLLLALSACGRVAFDSLADAAADSTGVQVDAPSPDAFASLCTDQRITIIRCGVAFDDSLAMTVPTAITGGCATNPTVTSVLQSDSGVLAPGTNEPLLPPTELGVMVGGDGPQLGLGYLVLMDTPVTWNVGAMATIQVRATGTTILNMVNYGPAHDYGVVLIVSDAISGTRYLSLQGPGQAGTAASVFWFNTVVAPALSTNSHTWYVIEWLDTDTDGAASSGDTFNLLARG